MRLLYGAAGMTFAGRLHRGLLVSAAQPSGRTQVRRRHRSVAGLDRLSVVGRTAPCGLRPIAIALRRRSAVGGPGPRARRCSGQWRSPALRAWAASYLPVALVLFVVLWDRPGIAAAVLWWIKPAFDRVLLFVYGRARRSARRRPCAKCGASCRGILGRTQLAGRPARCAASAWRAPSSCRCAQLEQLQRREARARRPGARARAPGPMPSG
ncbi:MAG: hypothetical protein MZW92_07945 [Comamonadaceae bacterium]|nr:hypothetical protein [Comamonadaceae bacterium]